MAETRTQIEVEDWVRQHWMPQKFGERFFSERLRLSSGGVFNFDAVNADHTTAATISTSGAKTASGKNAVGKMMKIRSDMFFLLLAEVKRRIVIFTEEDMLNQLRKERDADRVPSSIEFFAAELPAELRHRLVEARKRSSDEMS